MSAFKYRPSIDGMRAIAVISVLLYHLDKRLLPGGFVGVDIFFVISGYLITSIIYKDCINDHFSIAKFYQRRISRIFPVFFFISLAILIAAATLYSSQDFSSTGALAATSALSLTNIKLMFQGNYFEISSDSQPFLHCWSLSVEEQFYLFLPFTLVMSRKIGLSRKWLLVLLGILTATSFVACVMLTTSKPTWAFYLLPTRAWELLAGSMLAIGVYRQNEKAIQPSDHWLSILGLLLVIISIFVITEDRAFPGYIALIPVLGSLFLIGRTHDPRQFTESLLGNRGLLFIGKLSYSLYLWHWPTYCFVDYRMYDESVATRTAMKVGLTLILSLISYACIEKPVRAYLNVPNRKQLAFATFAVGILVFVTTGILIRSSNGYIDASLDNVVQGGIVFTTSDTAPNVVLMGDSTGSMYGRTMKAVASQAGVNINVISVAAENPFPPTQLYQSSLEFLAKKKPQVTIFVAAWTQQIGERRQKMQTALSEILKHTEHIVLITQAPVLPAYASREGIRKNGPQPIFEDSEFVTSRAQTNAYIQSLANNRVHILNIESLFVQNNGQIPFTDVHGYEMFRDKGHLSKRGADLVALPLITEIRKLLKDTIQTGPKTDPLSKLQL